MEISVRWSLKATGDGCCSNQEVAGEVEAFHSDF